MSRCEYEEAEKDKQADTKNTRRRIKVYLKINLPVTKTGSNRTKVYDGGFAIERKLLRLLIIDYLLLIIESREGI